MQEIKLLSYAAASVGSMAIIVLTSLAVVTQYKATGNVDNDTADNFIVGLGLFGVFLSVIVLALIGKIIYKIVMPKKGGAY